MTDGAALLLLASEEAIRHHGLPTLVRIVDTQWAALNPAEMGLGPVNAMAPLLARQGLRAAELDQIEINDAFAAQVLACLTAWSDPGYRRAVLRLPQPIADDPDPIDEARLNPEGGAIAIGHPVGASGARVVLHLALALNAKAGAGGAQEGPRQPLRGRRSGRGPVDGSRLIDSRPTRREAACERQLADPLGSGHRHPVAWTGSVGQVPEPALGPSAGRARDPAG